jgi:hypothetical protein
VAIDEGKIWREFLATIETVEKPVLMHYGSSYNFDSPRPLLWQDQFEEVGSGITLSFSLVRSLPNSFWTASRVLAGHQVWREAKRQVWDEPYCLCNLSSRGTLHPSVYPERAAG